MPPAQGTAPAQTVRATAPPRRPTGPGATPPKRAALAKPQAPVPPVAEQRAAPSQALKSVPAPVPQEPSAQDEAGHWDRRPRPGDARDAARQRQPSVPAGAVASVSGSFCRQTSMAAAPFRRLQPPPWAPLTQDRCRVKTPVRPRRQSVAAVPPAAAPLPIPMEGVAHWAPAEHQRQRVPLGSWAPEPKLRARPEAAAPAPRAASFPARASAAVAAPVAARRPHPRAPAVAPPTRNRSSRSLPSLPPASAAVVVRAPARPKPQAAAQAADSQSSDRAGSASPCPDSAPSPHPVRPGSSSRRTGWPASS